MSSYLYYKSYKKVKKPKIQDKSIPLLIRSLIKDAPTSGAKTFLESLMNYYHTYDGLTPKQMTALKDIELSIIERTSSDHEAWVKEYGDEKRKIATACAHYYAAHPPYYESLIKSVLTDPSFVPTQKQYISMCQNAYTKKVLAATNDDPVYMNGQLVQGRKTAPRGIRNKLCTVVASNDRPVTSAARGAKTYLVLPVGEATPIECEERHLKNFKK
tara:strand:- start:1124 stop:1768 length:645 start_codon:yes stop_codon:yes gene_type:complete